MRYFDLITPEGTRDLLFDECAAVKSEEERLRRIFSSNGYSEVITPGLEFYDVFNMKTRSFSQQTMYKLTDDKGRLMVLRPDSTMPIARIAATRLRDAVYPLKLFYSQSIYRANPKMAGRDDEIMQSGIEIIGGDEKRSDLEALSLAAQVLNSCESSDVRLEIGDNTFYKYLLDRLSIQDEETVRFLIETKNTPALCEYVDNAVGTPSREAEMLKKLPMLFGGAEVFDTAEELFSGTELSARLEELKNTFLSLSELENKDRLTVDLGLVNKAEYYTGIIFRGYIEEYGQAVISGGRYDTLVGSFGGEQLPAIGFAANINAIASALLKRRGGGLSKPADVLVFAESDLLTKGIRHCRELIENGESAQFCTLPDEASALSHAEKCGIKRVDIVSQSGIRTLMTGKES